MRDAQEGDAEKDTYDGFKDDAPDDDNAFFADPYNSISGDNKLLILKYLKLK